MVAIKPEELDKVRLYADRSVLYEDLGSHVWRRQTDVVQQVFVVACFCADLGKRVWFVDGSIRNDLKVDAFASGDIKGFFNRRCHDQGLKGRRVIVYDTVTTRRTGGRGSSAWRLHFHGIFEAASKDGLLAKLELIFGKAGPMGKRQFHVTVPDLAKSFSFKGVKVQGAIGKFFYAIKHSGAAYRSLKLNEAGKRSRAAPPTRRGANKHSDRLAKGDPSNFNKKVVFCDTVSKRRGKEAFEAWLAAEKLRPVLLAAKGRAQPAETAAGAA